jgi:hypothetical protein
MIVTDAMGELTAGQWSCGPEGIRGTAHDPPRNERWTDTSRVGHTVYTGMNGSYGVLLRRVGLVRARSNPDQSNRARVSAGMTHVGKRR